MRLVKRAQRDHSIYLSITFPAKVTSLYRVYNTLQNNYHFSENNWIYRNWSRQSVYLSSLHCVEYLRWLFAGIIQNK